MSTKYTPPAELQHLASEFQVVFNYGTDHCGRLRSFKLLRRSGLVWVDTPRGRWDCPSLCWAYAAEVLAKEARWESIYQGGK